MVNIYYYCKKYFVDKLNNKKDNKKIEIEI